MKTFKEELKELGFSRYFYKIDWLIKNKKYDSFNTWINIHNLNDLDDISKMYHYFNDIKEVPKCKVCNTDLTLKNRKIGYSIYCSKKCINNDPEVKSKMKFSREKTNLERYNTKVASKNKNVATKISKTKIEKSEIEKKKINEKRKQTFIDKYGEDNPSKIKEILDRRVNTFKNNIDKWKESYKKTCVEKYGVSHPWSSKDIREKYKSTMSDKYGEDNPSKVKEIRDKIESTSLKKYGQKSFFNGSLMKEIFIKKYGVENPWQIPSVIEKIKIKSKITKNNKILNLDKNILKILDNGNFLMNCESSNEEYEINRRLYFYRKNSNQEISLITNPIVISNSGPCNELLNFIKEWYDGPIKISDRKTLNGLEIDILLKDINLGIEFNGLYWHSELFKDKNYHANKSKLSLDSDINLIHIWEDDWNYRKDIIKSIIKNKLFSSSSIYARKCQIKSVSYIESKNFLNDNHIQGNVNSKYRFGLYFNDELVSLMTFGNLRKNLGNRNKEGYYELYRFCNKLNTRVVGGASKLFKHFITNYNPIEIISYADASRSNGNLYEQLNFSLSKLTTPGYDWIVNGIRENRWNYRKSELVKSGYDKNLTEVQIMHSLGHQRIWNCGNFLYKWEAS